MAPVFGKSVHSAVICKTPDGMSSTESATMPAIAAGKSAAKKRMPSKKTYDPRPELQECDCTIDVFCCTRISSAEVYGCARGCALEFSKHAAEYTEEESTSGDIVC